MGKSKDCLLSVNVRIRAARGRRGRRFDRWAGLIDVGKHVVHLANFALLFVVISPPLPRTDPPPSPADITGSSSFYCAQPRPLDNYPLLILIPRTFGH